MKWSYMVLVLGVLALSCRRNEICYPQTSQLTVRIEWPDGAKLPDGMRLLLYSVDRGTVATDEISPTGATEAVRYGLYRVILVSNDSQSIDFRGVNSFFSYEAYTKTLTPAQPGRQAFVDRPDRLWAAVDSVNINQEEQTLVFRPQDRVYHWHGTLKVNKINTIQSVKGWLSGMMGSLLLGTSVASTPSAVRFEVAPTPDGLAYDIYTFGPFADPNVPCYFVLEFASGTKKYVYHLNITDQIRKTGTFSVNDIADLPLSDSVGTSTGIEAAVNGWKRVVVELK